MIKGVRMRLPDEWSSFPSKELDKETKWEKLNIEEWEILIVALFSTLSEKLQGLQSLYFIRAC